jgi:hypothetical protein
MPVSPRTGAVIDCGYTHDLQFGLYSDAEPMSLQRFGVPMMLGHEGLSFSELEGNE